MTFTTVKFSKITFNIMDCLFAVMMSLFRHSCVACHYVECRHAECGGTEALKLDKKHFSKFSQKLNF